MNREIKFRVWDTKSNKWVYPVLDITNDFNDHLKDGGGRIYMQYTGTEDAGLDGEEIYEDDIIENVDTGRLQVVYWNSDKSAWYCRYVYDKERIVSLRDSLGNLNKKIGNIHNNPSIIEK